MSLFLEMSSELIHSLIPVFMVSVLGASLLSVGIIEGIAESTASFTKAFPEVFRDYWAKRKPQYSHVFFILMCSILRKAEKSDG